MNTFNSLQHKMRREDLPFKAVASQRALIVGASRGIGLGLAKELANRRWAVIGTVRNRLGRERLIGPKSNDALALTAETVDIQNSSEVDALAERLKGVELDLLVLNAGVHGPGHQSAERAAQDEIGSLFYTNAVAPILVARRLLGLVRENTGIIAFMSSRLGSIEGNTDGQNELYRASKAALNSMTRSFVVKDARSRGISVVSLHPGWVRTDMGGKSASLDVSTSVKGVADVIEAQSARGAHKFLDYQGRDLPW